jgi:hypothetical protein
MPIFILSERTKHGFFFSTPIPLQKSSLATENDHSVPFVTNVGSTLLYRSSQFNRGTVNLFFSLISLRRQRRYHGIFHVPIPASWSSP